MQPVLVFAGTYQQYLDLIANKGLDRRKYLYVDGVRHLMGRRGAHYIRVGEWWLGPWNDAAEYVASGGFVEDDPPA